ncbi:MAG: hypothetical protein KDN05_10250 [Verrucomicrobiae bacterium]|nr:hypothetical protein [Verrucomicrobiae bacterium]MCB1204409.1 hypothetical protein [Verrucomicrobiae bacterium]
MSTEICHFCGHEIRFRNIKGAPVPLHPTGSNCLGKKLYQFEARDICHPTTCPRCSANVFFIRHNGGCAWFDQLGAPWEKHPCFVRESVTPTSWQNRMTEDWTVQFLLFEGTLRDASGGVFVITPKRLDNRCSGRYRQQFKMQRPGTNHESLWALNRKSILLNQTRDQAVTMDGGVWKVSEHTPSYREEHHRITRLY